MIVLAVNTSTSSYFSILITICPGCAGVLQAIYCPHRCRPRPYAHCLPLPAGQYLGQARQDCGGWRLAGSKAVRPDRRPTFRLTTKLPRTWFRMRPRLPSRQNPSGRVTSRSTACTKSRAFRGRSPRAIRGHGRRAHDFLAGQGAWFEGKDRLGDLHEDEEDGAG